MMRIGRTERHKQSQSDSTEMKISIDIQKGTNGRHHNREISASVFWSVRGNDRNSGQTNWSAKSDTGQGGRHAARYRNNGGARRVGKRRRRGNVYGER